MADLTMDRDQVGRQLKELTGLLDLIDTQTEPISTAKACQHTAVWSEIDACKAFAASYAGAIDEFEVALKDIRDSIGIALTNVRDSADNLANQDQALRTDYENLAKRLDLGAAAAAPVAQPAAAAPATATVPGKVTPSPYAGGTKIS